MVDESRMVAVAGPTASGKSELAVRLALEFNGEIVNCDSVQLYRGFDIGTAKTPVGERRGVPHHLIDILDPGEVFTAGDYLRLGRRVLREIASRGHTPVVSGGTGFYLKALLEGLFAGPARDPALRERLAERERRRTGSLHRILSRLDPDAARRIHARDVNKTMRALEVCLLTRRPITKLFSGGRDALSGFKTVKIGLNPPRDGLYRRIDLRTRGMFEGGLVEEVRCLLARGVPRSAKPFESVGYREALTELDGRLTREEAVAATQQATRNYAKRQWTWFRRDPGIIWLDGFGDDPVILERAVEIVRDHW